MDGLLLKLSKDETGRPGFWFWKLFASVRQDLDRYYWVFPYQPWMAYPLDILERQDEFEGELFEPFEERDQSSIQLWRPGNLSKYAALFGEEFIELWAIEPEVDDAQRMTSIYSHVGWGKQEEFAHEHARVWLLYTDSTCWEIFSRRKPLLDRVRESLEGMPWVEVFSSQSTQRGHAFGMAGLSEVWQAMKG